jgi:hypothetical protein
MMRRVFTGLAGLTCLVVLLALGTETVFADSGEGKAVALGKRPILNDNLPKAKKEAVADALQTSVERAVVAMLSRSDIAENLDFLWEQVLADPQKYVETYRVVAELEKENQYMVAVEATVNARALEALFTRAKILNTAKDTPSVLFFISEQSFDEVLPRYWWGNNPLPYDSSAEAALTAVLAKQGYTIVGDDSPRPDPATLGIPFDFIHDATAAIKLGTALKADMVVMGKARAEEPSNRMGDDRSYGAAVVLEVYATATGERIASIEHAAVVKSDAVAEGAGNALTRAGELAGQELLSKLQGHWAAHQRTVRAIETRVEGADYLSSFIMLRKVLNNMPGIEDVQTKEIGSDQAVVDILFKGNAGKLADLLMLKSFDSFDIEMSEVTENTMVIRFVTKENMAPVEPSEIKKAYISE